jgi:hypothetical protein
MPAVVANHEDQDPSFIACFLKSSSLGLNRALQLANIAWACSLNMCVEPVLTDELEIYTFATFKNMHAKRQ